MATQKFKWQKAVAKYAFPDTWRSWWQLINSLVPFLFLWYLAYRSLEVSYWLTLLLLIPPVGSKTGSVRRRSDPVSSNRAAVPM